MRSSTKIHRATKKSPAQLDREIIEALGPGKHKGNRYVGMQGPEYRQGWDDAGSDIRVAWRKELMDALGDEPLKVAIDALLEGDVESGLKLVHMSGTFEASLENRAFRNAGWSATQQLDVRRIPKATKHLVDEYKRTFGRQWQAGYVDRVLDMLEKKVGLREA